MTKKHFIILAETVRAAGPTFRSTTHHARFALDMGRALARVNPRFDMRQWLRACMPSAVGSTRKATMWEKATGYDL